MVAEDGGWIWGLGRGLGGLRGRRRSRGGGGFEFGFGCGERYGYGLEVDGVGEEGLGGCLRDGLAGRGCMPRRGYPGRGG